MTITESILKEINYKINNLLKEKDQIIISIEGRAGSGKTTLASKLNGYVFHIDDYFNKTNTDEIGSNINQELLLNDIFKQLKKKKESFEYTTFNCKTKEYKLNTYKKNKIIIVEGVYSYLPCFQKYYDLLIYCESNKEEQQSRLQKRPNYQDFLNIWLPKEDKYFQEINPKIHADIIIN